MSESADNPGREFRRRLAMREENNAHVTPEDVLLDVLEDLRSGDLPIDQIVVCYRIPEDDGYRVGYASAQADRPNQIALLHLVTDLVVERWKAGS